MNIESSPIMCESMHSGAMSYREENITIKTKKPRAKKVKMEVPDKEESSVKEAVQVETIADTIRKLIDDETALEKIRNEVRENTSTEGKDVLSHLGEYIEEPYHLIDSYFQGQHLERLVRHQIES